MHFFTKVPSGWCLWQGDEAARQRGKEKEEQSNAWSKTELEIGITAGRKGCQTGESTRSHLE